MCFEYLADVIVESVTENVEGNILTPAKGNKCPEGGIDLLAPDEPGRFTWIQWANGSNFARKTCVCGDDPCAILLHSLCTLRATEPAEKRVPDILSGDRPVEVNKELQCHQPETSDAECTWAL
jgi:hypothetical protein